MGKKVYEWFRKLHFIRKTLLVMGGFLLVITVSVLLSMLSIYLGTFGRLPSRQELLDFNNATASIVYSRDGRIIGRFFTENRTNVSYDQIPDHLKDALIATEDARFYRHRGVDRRSLVRVLVKSILFNDRGAGGGSTISQQLAKNIYGRESLGRMTIPINKTREIFIAYRVEKNFSKQDILTLYLNTVPFGENVFGIEAASRRFFNKKTEDLTVGEAAVLVGMLKGNTLYNPRMHPENARIRRNVVLRQMEKYNYLAPGDADSLVRLPLVLNYSNLEVHNPAGYFLAQVRREAEMILQETDSVSGKKWNIGEDGLIITATLDVSLQNYALKAFNDHMPPMQDLLRQQYATVSGTRILNGIAQMELNRLDLSRRAEDTIVQRTFTWEGSFNERLTVLDSVRKALTLLHGGLLVLDPATGAVRTWIGGIDHLTQPFDQVLARRQMASAFKPVLYSAALEEGIEPCNYFSNDSIVLEDHDNWTPVNYDLSIGGEFTLTESLVRSLNIPTYNLFREVGFGRLDSLWKSLGFSYRLTDNPSLSLGTAEANILETAVAYASLANGGLRVTPYTISSIQAPDGTVIYRRSESYGGQRVLSERTVHLINAILRKAIDEGTGVSLRSAYGVTIPLAGKTGTSQNYADAWFAAYNPSLVVVSRVGASSRAISFNNGRQGSGSALALPLVARTLRNLQQDRSLAASFNSPFPELPPELADLLDCTRQEERGVFERFLEMFRRDLPERVTTPEEEKPGLLRRIFRRRN